MASPPNTCSLLFPDDWFSYWRMNCLVAGYYWLTTKEAGYELENKWTFLQRCMEKNVPCSPCLTGLKVRQWRCRHWLFIEGFTG